ncbi:MAG: extracellular solute-binding protein [Butyrivibrio sp.]|nr:extracellular solute-binding protein [Muribaculum sp.]MCM1553314.1 extracellular solute-binding protein [Butyrivibrio sp.]
MTNAPTESASTASASQAEPKAPKIEIPEGRTPVVIEVWSASYNLEEAVVNFNKENTDYWAYVIDYGYDAARSGTDSPEGKAARQRVQLELTTGNNCPDLIYLDTMLLPVNELAREGYLEDLNPYLDNSAVLDREELMEFVLDAYTMEDKLMALPLYFTLNYYTARQSQVQQFETWTLQDMLDYAREYPDALLLEHDSLYYYLSLLSLYEEPFVTVENGKYTVNREQIEEFLLIINRHNEIELPELPYPPDLYLSNHVLLQETWKAGDFDSQQYDSALMEGDVAYIGYPSEDGRNIKLSGYETYGIPLHATQKEGAWAFLEYYIQSAGEHGGLFPVKKADYEKFKETELTHKGFAPDENGILVDSSGHAQQMRSWNDWTYCYREITQEDIEIMEEMFTRAGHPFMGMGYTASWMEIFNDEVPAYLNGDKSLSATVDIIVSRYQLFINERH